jgi:hypothetical protein
VVLVDTTPNATLANNVNRHVEPLSRLHEKYNLTIGGAIPTDKNRGAAKKGLRRQRPSTSSTSTSTSTNLEAVLPGIDEQPFYCTYSATTALLLVVHILYAKQIWKRKLSRRNFLVNYNRLVQRKHYHMAIGALLGHAPTKAGNSSNSNSNESSTLADSRQETSAIRDRDRTSIQHGNDQLIQNHHSGPYSLLSRILPVLSRVYSEYAPGIVGPFGADGLPLLFYCAHILWSCRALEVVFGSGWDYARVLWALTWTGLAMDLGFTYALLNMLRDMHYATSAPFAMGASLWTTSSNGARPIARQVERVLVQRSIGSLTTTTCAVLFVFRDHFHVPIPVIPFLPTEWPILGIPIVSHILVVGILLALSHPIHPVAGVSCGSLAGLLWVSGWTNFLADPYWSNGSITAYVVLCLLAFKANNTFYLPCIDYVAWDSRGEMVQEFAEQQEFTSPSTSRTISNETLDDDPDDTADAPFSVGETSRHLQHRISSSSLNFLLDDDNDEEEENANDDSHSMTAEMTPLVPPSASVNLGPTMRSRRPPSSGSRL